MVSGITSSYSGGTPKAGTTEYYDGDIPFIRSGEIYGNTTELFITEEGLNSSSAKMVHIGDILYALYGATSGEVSRAKLDGAINQAILAIIPNDEVNADFLVEWFRKEKTQITDKYLQGGQGNLSAQIIKDLIVTIPTCEEQNKIGEYFSKINHLITLHHRKYMKNIDLSLFAWEQRKLPEFVTFFNGLTYTPNDVEETGTLVLRSSNVKNGEIVDADNVYVNDKVATSENVEEDDIIVVVRNGSRALIGKHAQIKASMPNTVIGAFMIGMRSEHSSFVNALLDTSAFENEIAKNMGATINQITGYMFSKMEFMIPSGEEQQQIGEYFQSLDHLITLHQRKCEETKILKKYMLQKMFPQNGHSVPEIRFSGFTEDWEQRKLKEIANKVSEKNKNNEFSEPFTNSAEQGIISQKDYFDREIVNNENLDGYYIVRNDDFIYNPRISVTAPVGPINRNRLGRNGVMSPLYTVFRTHDIDNLYLEFYFKTTRWHRFMKLNGDSGARFDRFTISSTQFMEMPIPYPTLDEQQTIGKYFDSLDHLITLHQQKCDELRNIKKFMLQNMFI